MLIETITGLALTFAIIGAILLIRSLLPKSCPVPGVERQTILRCHGDAAGLEAAMREPWETKAQITIVDAGMTAEALRRAEILALRYGAEIRKEAPHSSPAGDGEKNNSDDSEVADGREQD